MFFEVIPTEVYRNGGGALTYSSDQKLLPGHIVLIPLGRRTVLGIVLRQVQSVDFPTKPIARLLHPLPLPAHLLKSALWLSKYYLSPLPMTTELMIPAGLATRTAFKTSQLVAYEPKTAKRRTTKQPTTNTSSGSKNAQAVKTSSANAQKSLKLPLIPLNTAQKTALQSLQEAPGPTRLLRGVTGSGKTNIYLKLAADTLKQQKSVILLVPEIALTSQLVQIFEQTFGKRVLLIHSAQTMAERRRIWLQILENTIPQVIIGPRSALLAPLNNLGLIIIDEAHESAYYQENTPRYAATRLASFMASSLKIPCILGTATPNLTDYYLAKTKNTLTELSAKAKTTALDPKICIVDFKDRPSFSRNRYFSNQLLTKIKNNIQAKHQTLIFHNRRGSAPLTICEECGWQALCPECYLPMILHANTYTLSCHVCGHSEKVPSSCPNCHHPGIIHKGFGTQLLESELTSLFPNAKIARFDGDNKKTDDLASLYQEVKSGAIDILIGTQTLARGLDLPHLATVGIVQADAGLSLPDFAAEERTFELLTQVIGRVGRGHLDIANVIIQTYQPDHPVIKTAITADFPAFAKHLLKNRRTGQLPPFIYLAKLSVTYKTEKTTLAKIQQAATTLQKNSSLQVSPPLPAFHERTSRGYTWQIIIKSTSREALRQALFPFSNSPQFSVVLDPPSLL